MNPRSLLMPLGALYQGIIETREILFSSGIFKAESLPAPVISVGNLTVGGVGKTPFVDLLLRQFEEKGIKTCVLTRGYGRKSKGPLEAQADFTVEMVGDEASWLKKCHPQTQIIVSENRAVGARLANKNTGVFVLDDGFQNRDVKKDFEIVLVDATRPLWHYRMLPAGLARLPFSYLRHADMICLTRVNQANGKNLADLKEELKGLGQTKIFEMDIVFKEIRDLFTGSKLEQFDKSHVALVSAIGNPQSFEKLVFDNVTDKVLFHKIFQDHHTYTKGELLEFGRKAREQGVELILTTEKDEMKIKDLLNAKEIGITLGVVKAGVEFLKEAPDFYDIYRRFNR